MTTAFDIETGKRFFLEGVSSGGGDTSNCANKDLSNLSTTGKSTASGLGMPSSRYSSITLKASGSTYTAPANGYYSLRTAHSGSAGFLNITNNTKLISQFCNYTGSGCGVMMFARKNDVIQVDHYLVSSTYWFRFIYAEGEA